MTTDQIQARAVDALKYTTARQIRDGEDWADVALRLRGAAVLAHSAGLEPAVVSGWNAAASAAGGAGVLDGESSDE